VRDFINRPFHNLRATYAYDLVMRIFGASWFLFLSYNVAWRIGHEIELSAIVAQYCLVIFYLILCLLLIKRPLAKSQAKGFFPRFAAFAGTFMPWMIVFFPRSASSASLSLLSAVCLIVGMVLAIISVTYLGKSFSVIPQAREVVRTGPYRWLRHPLYASEQIAVLGTLLQFLSPFTMSIFAIHITIQICRIVYEERLLRQAFPEYSGYAMTSWRLLPFVW
jgi:protein-S-isoprenylcysteine O-methyltransferase Ste14